MLPVTANPSPCSSKRLSQEVHAQERIPRLQTPRRGPDGIINPPAISPRIAAPAAEWDPPSVDALDSLAVEPVGQHPGDIRDAEMSVEFLCRKYEALRHQLKREEASRQEAERRTSRLTSEVQAAQDSLFARRNAASEEMHESDIARTALRATATTAEQRAHAEEQHAREEQLLGAELEQECERLQQECSAQVSLVEKGASQLAALEKEGRQARCEQAELSRRLRQIQGDTRVSKEDLRIAQHRSVLVCNELQALELGLDVASKSREDFEKEGDVTAQRSRERQQELFDCEAHVKSITEALEALRQESSKRKEQLDLSESEVDKCQVRLSELEKAVASTQHVSQGMSGELSASVEQARSLEEELNSVEKQRTNASEVASLSQQTLQGIGSSIQEARKTLSQAQAAKVSLTKQLEELTAEEQRGGLAASTLRRARHAEDLHLEDLKGELQTAHWRRDALSEDLAKNLRLRDQLSAKLRNLQPEIADVEDQCQDLEKQLAERARDLESELVQQRHAQQEAVRVAESLRELQIRQARLDADLQLHGAFETGEWRSPVKVHSDRSLRSEGSLLPRAASTGGLTRCRGTSPISARTQGRAPQTPPWRCGAAPLPTPLGTRRAASCAAAPRREGKSS